MARSRVGFLCGPGGNPTGLGSYVRALDAAGIPATVGAYDVTTGLSDALALNSSVPHTLYYRVVRDGSERYAVPAYHLSPKDAAVAHWALIRPLIAKEVADNRDRIWIAPINECDKNRADWLGWFSVELALLMRAEGFKQIALGWSAGEPEPEHWETPGVLAYLRMCQADPDGLGICLHEGSMVAGQMEYDGWTIGRFRFLHDTCDRHGIARPKIIIGEFAWDHKWAPEPAQAIEHLRVVAPEFARHPNILGVGIWYLGNYLGIADKVQKLIKPVTDFTIATVFPDPETPKEQEPVNELEKAIWEASLNLQNQRGISWNPDFGFPTAIRNAGYWPATNETTVLIGGVQYVIMVAEHPTKGQPRKVFAYKHPWGSGPVIEIVDPKV